jgi:hypothetical protein
LFAAGRDEAWVSSEASADLLEQVKKARGGL